MCEVDYIPRCTCWMWQCFESMSLAYPLQLIHFCCFRNAAARYTYQADALAPGAEWCFRRCFHVESMPRTWRCYLQTLWASLGATSPKMLLVLYCSYSQWQTMADPYISILYHMPPYLLGNLKLLMAKLVIYQDGSPILDEYPFWKRRLGSFSVVVQALRSRYCTKHKSNPSTAVRPSWMPSLGSKCAPGIASISAWF